MTTTNFTTRQTVIEADWLNDVDKAVYDVLGNPDTVSDVRTTLGVNSASDLASTDSDVLGDALVGGKRTDSGAVAFTIHSFNENRFPNVKTDFGAIGDGATNDSSSITSANALGVAVQVPNGTYNCTSVAATDLDGPYFGDGQIKDSAGNTRGKYFSAVKAAPSSEGTHTSVSTAFNGDLSKVQFAVEHRITGAATLGQPSSGYRYVPEAYPNYTYLYNSSGWNEDTASSDGRTAACAFRASVYNAGQGDCVAFNARGTVTGARAGATNFLANPAVSLFNGDVLALQAGTYLNPMEIGLDDNGFDVAGVGGVFKLTRSVSTGALSATWIGLRVQSKGTEDLDGAFSATGPIAHGLDFSKATISGSAIALKADQKIYGNVTNSGEFPDDISLGSEYFGYINSTSSWDVIVGGQPVVRMTKNGTPVNYIKIISQATGIGPVLTSSGSDTNVQLNVWTQGTGGIAFGTNSGTVQTYIANTASAVNYCYMSGGATGTGPQVAAAGTDTDIDLRLVPKGAGLIKTGYASAAAGTPANFTADRYLAFKDSSGTTYYIPCRASTW